MSAFWPKADMSYCAAHVRFQGKADMVFCGNPLLRSLLGGKADISLDKSKDGVGNDAYERRNDEYRQELTHYVAPVRSLAPVTGSNRIVADYWRCDQMKMMSANGPKQTCASALQMSAFGGKADMPFCTAYVCF